MSEIETTFKFIDKHFLKLTLALFLTLIVSCGFTMHNLEKVINKYEAEQTEKAEEAKEAEKVESK